MPTKPLPLHVSRLVPIPLPSYLQAHQAPLPFIGHSLHQLVEEQ